MIKIEALSKSFGKNAVLKDIYLTFKKGKVYGVVGKNGAGKTTLFSCIAGLETYGGSVLYDNEVLKNVTGFLHAVPYFMSKLTGNEYIHLFCEARNIPFKRADEENIFNLPLNTYVETYSTGMKKKLALQAILLQKNDVFILDEPFSGIDIESNILLTQIIEELKKLIEELKKRGKIVLISSHIFSILQETCDVLHYLYKGEIKQTVPKSDFYRIENEMRNKEMQNRLTFLDN